MKELLEKVINKMADQKAEADVILSTSKALKISSQKGVVSEYKVSSSQILGLRAIKDGKVGLSYTEALDEESLDLLVRQALENAEIAEPNSLERILKLSGHLADEASYPGEEVDIQLKTVKALELETKPREADSRVVAVPYNAYSENEFSSLYLSTQGRSTSYKDKVYSITSSALMDDQGKKATFYDYHATHRFNDLNWAKVIETSIFHAKNLLQEKTLATGRYSVRFHEDCLKNLLECFGNFFSAKSAMDKVNPWALKTGEKVISENISIIDDPFYKFSFRTSLFDSEGVERKPLALIQDGTLRSLYHNSVTASFFNTQTTGHGSRGASGPLTVAGTNVIIQGKNPTSLPERYLEVIQMDGLYSGADRVSGNFSVAIKGYVWERGERVQTFGNITLSGNLMELLNKAEVTGLELVPSTDRSFFSVPLVFHDLSIAGA